MTALERIDGVPVWRAVGATPGPSVANEKAGVVIVGAGPVGLTMALDLARRGRPVTVLNQLAFVAAGSKAICFAKRTLDVWDRLDVGEKMVAKGVSWNVGKVFHGGSGEPIYTFDMLPVKHQKMPGFINLQQYHVEEILLEALAKFECVDLRWGHQVVGVEPRDDSATLQVRTDGGDYVIDADWVLACDGSRSPVRNMLGLDFQGRVFEDNFLIADIRLKDKRPAERWFWFDPPFNPGGSALLHQQPDDVMRLDFQLGWNVDREACVRPENVEPFVRGMLGDVAFEPEWYSVYTFQCRRMESFVHGRVVFAGDSAHLVSPFGARGCNGGVADVDNLGWKLDLVLAGQAPEGLIASFDYEAVVTADENILNSTRSTDFMTPKSGASQAFRSAVLDLARSHSFARPFVNSGRLSMAVAYPSSPLSTPDESDAVWAGVAPGAVALDAPVANGWLLEALAGGRFVLLHQDASLDVTEGITVLSLQAIGDPEGLVSARYDLQPGSAYLIRPDQYVAARWRRPTQALVEAALRKAMGKY
ncbi:MAG: FAD-dependent oxidoreductase [Caulobacter sp.]|nr:FAD-dependent oxidoreductase [Caulobacter sp.]